jgi:catalase
MPWSHSGGEDYPLTTNQGVRIADDQNSLRAGTRGPTLLEDFILRRRSPTSTTSEFRRIVHTRSSCPRLLQPYKA